MARGQVDDLLPDPAGRRIAPLEAEGPGAGLVVEGGVLPGAGAVVGVEGFEGGEKRFALAGRHPFVGDPGQEDAETLAPVAEVVVADGAVAERAENIDDGLTDDRGADVPDVHPFGDVR